MATLGVLSFRGVSVPSQLSFANGWKKKRIKQMVKIRDRCSCTHTEEKGGGSHTHNRVKIAETDTGSRWSVLSGRARDPVNISFMLFIIHTRAPHNAASSRDRHNMFSTLVPRASLVQCRVGPWGVRARARPGGRGRWRALVRDTTTMVIYYYNVIVVMCPSPPSSTTDRDESQAEDGEKGK